MISPYFANRIGLHLAKCHVVQIDTMLTLQNVITSELPSKYVVYIQRYTP
jgi:hypothetical protein